MQRCGLRVALFEVFPRIAFYLAAGVALFFAIVCFSAPVYGQTAASSSGSAQTSERSGFLITITTMHKGGSP
jgi:hypothetical protein